MVKNYISLLICCYPDGIEKWSVPKTTLVQYLFLWPFTEQEENGIEHEHDGEYDYMPSFCVNEYLKSYLPNFLYFEYHFFWMEVSASFEARCTQTP